MLALTLRYVVAEKKWGKELGRRLVESRTVEAYPQSSHSRSFLRPRPFAFHSLKAESMLENSWQFPVARLLEFYRHRWEVLYFVTMSIVPYLEAKPTVARTIFSPVLASSPFASNSPQARSILRNSWQPSEKMEEISMLKYPRRYLTACLVLEIFGEFFSQMQMVS